MKGAWQYGIGCAAVRPNNTISIQSNATPYCEVHVCVCLCDQTKLSTGVCSSDFDSILHPHARLACHVCSDPRSPAGRPSAQGMIDYATRVRAIVPFVPRISSKRPTEFFIIIMMDLTQLHLSTQRTSARRAAAPPWCVLTRHPFVRRNQSIFSDLLMLPALKGKGVKELDPYTHREGWFLVFLREESNSTLVDDVVEWFSLVVVTITPLTDPHHVHSLKTT